MQVGSSSAILEQPEKDHQQTLSSDVNRDEGDCQQGGFDDLTRLLSPSFVKQNHRSSLTATSQHQCGTHRRCLQFEDSQRKTLVNNDSSWNPTNPTNPAASSSSAGGSMDSDVLKPSHEEIHATGGSTQVANATQPASPMSSRDNRNLSTAVSMSAGIGLHLNSIVAAMPLDSAVISGVQSANKGNWSLKGQNALSVRRDHVSDNTRNCFKSSNVTMNVLASIEDTRDESNTSATEYNQISIGRKRKKTSSMSKSVDCKQCNCKKTKCLKLYCDCFAAGIYCDGSCGCQGCFNRPDYEDTVSETRKQIESRNPLAFAPKIIKRATRAPAISSQDINQSTPFSARHKRGCNCKKSMCLKKYCECYQANVGCSSGCRCEVCKNTYGRKEEYCLDKYVVSNQDIDGRSEGLFDEKLDLVPVKDGLFHTDIFNPQNLTPLTPSLQCSDPRKNALTRFLPGKYLLSPESNPTCVATFGRPLEIPRNFTNPNMVAENHKDALDFVSFEDLNFGNMGELDKFSTGYHGNMSNLTDLPHSSSTMASLMSPKKSEHENGSTVQFFSGSVQSQSLTSFHWHGSPATPKTQFEKTKLVDVLDSSSRLDDIMEDETLDILKYDSTPHNTVKASSPNKKRISPPHGCLSERGSSSSADLRTGRKFILQAVPSFPPLNPCVDLKSSNIQNRSNPKDHCNTND